METIGNVAEKEHARARGGQAVIGDLQLRLAGSQTQESAARAEVRRLSRELALARRLLRFSAGAVPVGPRRTKAVTEIPRLSVVLLTREVKFHVDACVNRGAHTFLSGWAFLPVPEWDGHAAKVTLLFHQGARTYAASTGYVPRPDVAAHFATQGDGASGGARGLDGTGFACEILHSSLPEAADFEIALRLECNGLVGEQSTGMRLCLER